MDCTCSEVELAMEKVLFACTKSHFPLWWMIEFWVLKALLDAWDLGLVGSEYGVQYLLVSLHLLVIQPKKKKYTPLSYNLSWKCDIIIVVSIFTLE